MPPNNDNNYYPFETEPGKRGGRQRQRRLSGSNSNFRGFSTSISDLFTDEERERIDCCSMACCGTLQSDKNRYLVMKIKPPGCLRRVFLHLLLPFFIFASATFSAITIYDPYMNQLFSTGFILILITYLVLQCYKGSSKRSLTRKEYLWSKWEYTNNGGNFRMRNYDEDSTIDSIDEYRLASRDFEDDSPVYFMGQTLSDIRHAHGLCGCYRHDDDNDYSSDEKKREEPIHFCGRIFQRINNVGRFLCCQRHFQLCGMCALAQEARDLELVLDAGQLRIDYVTMQPMLEYYPAIYEERYSTTTTTTRTTWWWGRLSQFSKDLLRSCILLLILLFGWSLLANRINHKFGLLSFIVFCFTVTQSLIVLYLVYRKFQKDVSLDAVIKFAVSGFCLSTSFAFFFEVGIGLTLRLFISAIVTNIAGISQVQTNEYSGIGLVGSSSSSSSSEFGVVGSDGTAQVTGSSGGPSSMRDFLSVYGREHPIFYTFVLFFNAFILSALIEELCKYFGYRMVEHPGMVKKSIY